MHRLFPILITIPLLLGFLVTSETEPYQAPDALPLLHWSTWVDTIEDPHLRIVFYQRYGQLPSRCTEDAQVAQDLASLNTELHARIMDLAGRSTVIASFGRTELKRFDPFSGKAHRLRRAVSELEARQQLEERYRKMTAQAFGRAQTRRWHSPDWCHYDAQMLEWLQHRHWTLSQATLRLIEEMPAGKTNHYLGLIQPR